jgi:hypothetical protein
MHNEKYQNYLLLYHYGELDDNLKQDFLTHLKRCPECKRELALLKDVDNSLTDQAFTPSRQVLDKIYKLSTVKSRFDFFDFIKNIFAVKFFKPAVVFALAIVVVVVFNIYKKPALPENLWFDDLDNQVAMIEDEVQELRNSFGYEDYLIDAKINEIETMIDETKISEI